ncbi:MOSC domain-containing protein [soil metagenome]
MGKLLLSAIYIYPIKSLGGIRLGSAAVEERGLQYDRRWMLIDDAGMFLTQRKMAEMALLRVTLQEEGLEVTHLYKGLDPLFVPYETRSANSTLVTVWDDICFAYIVSREANRWFSEALGLSCRLVHMPDTSIRLIDPNYARHGEKTSFSDGFPFLLAGQASLDDLNGRLEEPVPMDRFRPNFVVSGAEPFAEDTWKTIRIGSVMFYAPKPCGRCIVTTTNQETAVQSAEPLRTLNTFRRKENKVYFGQNLIGLSAGTVREGDLVQVLEGKPPIL